MARFGIPFGPANISATNSDAPAGPISFQDPPATSRKRS